MYQQSSFTAFFLQTSNIAANNSRSERETMRTFEEEDRADAARLP